MSKIDEYYPGYMDDLARNTEVKPISPSDLIPPPVLIAPGELPTAGAFDHLRRCGVRRWVVDATMTRDIDEAFGPEKTELYGNIIYQSQRSVVLLDDFICAMMVGIHKCGVMLCGVVDPYEGQAVSWQDEQLAKRNRGERAISLLGYDVDYCLAVWSIHSPVESTRIYFVMIGSELSYEYSDDFSMEERIEQEQRRSHPARQRVLHLPLIEKQQESSKKPSKPSKKSKKSKEPSTKPERPSQAMRQGLLDDVTDSGPTVRENQPPRTTESVFTFPLRRFKKPSKP